MLSISGVLKEDSDLYCGSLESNNVVITYTLPVGHHFNSTHVVLVYLALDSHSGSHQCVSFASRAIASTHVTYIETKLCVLRCANAIVFCLACRTRRGLVHGTHVTLIEFTLACRSTLVLSLLWYQCLYQKYGGRL